MNEWHDISDALGVPLGSLENLEVEMDSLKIYASFDFDEKLIVFDDFLSFRFVFESYALDILGQHQLNGISWLFASANTEYCHWFDSQNDAIYANEYTQYRLVFFNHIVDVLSKSPPKLIEQ